MEEEIKGRERKRRVGKEKKGKTKEKEGEDRERGGKMGRWRRK